MNRTTIALSLVTVSIMALVAWWSFSWVPAEPIELPQPPIEQHLRDRDSDSVEVEEVFRSEFNVQGSVRTLTLLNDRILTQYCDSMLAGCISVPGTTTAIVTDEDYESILSQLRTVQSGAQDTPEPDMAVEAYFYAVHTIDDVRVEHTALHPAVRQVEAVLNQYLSMAE